jgi:hypothetical protein
VIIPGLWGKIWIAFSICVGRGGLRVSGRMQWLYGIELPWNGMITKKPGK